MGVTAAKIVVTHSFEVITDAEVASVIHVWDVNNLLFCGMDCVADLETWGHLKVGGKPRFLNFALALPPLC